ncbi:MAG: hypothetical protein WBA68_09205 [Alteraurantiacibacter sp.]
MALLVYSKWSLDALWFTGAGLAICLASAINFASFSGRSGLLAAAFNLAMTAWFAAALFVLPGPQVVAGVAVFAALCVLSLVPKSERPVV